MKGRRNIFLCMLHFAKDDPEATKEENDFFKRQKKTD
jgi:hypothetical protein